MEEYRIMHSHERYLVSRDFGVALQVRKRHWPSPGSKASCVGVMIAGLQGFNVEITIHAFVASGMDD